MYSSNTENWKLNLASDQSVTVIINDRVENDTKIVHFYNAPDFRLDLECEREYEHFTGDFKMYNLNSTYSVKSTGSNLLPNDDGEAVSIRALEFPLDFNDIISYAAFPGDEHIDSGSARFGMLLTMTDKERDDYFMRSDNNVPYAIAAREISSLWRFSKADHYGARRDKIREIWPELGDALDALPSRV